MRKWTDEDLRQAVAKNISVAGVIRDLGLIPAGGNYATINTKIQELRIDRSHFKAQAHNKGKKFGPKRPLEDYLSNRFPIQSWSLKNRLLREGIFEHKCYSCGLDKWLDKMIPLELEHIDGNHFNNAKENLTLLCPNCHALTSTYRGKNKGRAGMAERSTRGS